MKKGPSSTPLSWPVRSEERRETGRRDCLYWKKGQKQTNKRHAHPPQQRNRAPTPPWLHMWILASQLFAEPHSAEISGSLMHLEALLLLAIKIILRRQLCVFPWLLLLFFLFLFFLDESFYQLVPYHQIDQTVKSLGLPASEIGPIIHNHRVCLVTDNAPLRGWPSKCDGKSPGTRNLLPKQKYLLKFFGVCVSVLNLVKCFQLKTGNHTQIKLVLYFVNVGGKVNYLIVSFYLCAPASAFWN